MGEVALFASQRERKTRSARRDRRTFALGSKSQRRRRRVADLLPTLSLPLSFPRPSLREAKSVVLRQTSLGSFAEDTSPLRTSHHKNTRSSGSRARARTASVAGVVGGAVRGGGSRNL